MELKLADKKSELLDILRIQKENQLNSLSCESSKTNGFVTVTHTYEVIEKMNSRAKQVIAKMDDQVVGYALVMLKEFRDLIPVLIPMFEKFSVIEYNGQKLDKLHLLCNGANMCSGRF